MDKEFFSQQEEIGFEKMYSLNEYFQLSDFGRTPEKYDFDASGVTKTGSVVAIEIKNRLNYTLEDFKRFGSVVIEPHKLAEMYTAHIFDKYIPLYVNFTEDGYAIVFNLTDTKDIKYSTSQRYASIQSKGYERTEKGGRFEIPMSYAKVYWKDCGEWKRVN